ncbi:MAG: DNA polymerase IV [Alsobacter sp.]
MGITTGADLKAWSLHDLEARFGKSGSWFYGIARGIDHHPVNAARVRKSSGSETTFDEDLIDTPNIEAGVLAMANDVWARCVKTGRRARTVTVKVKWADFQQVTRSRSVAGSVESQAQLDAVSLELVRSVYPPRLGVRLVGVTLSNFASAERDKPDFVLPLEQVAAPA